MTNDGVTITDYMEYTTDSLISMINPYDDGSRPGIVKELARRLEYGVAFLKKLYATIPDAKTRAELSIPTEFDMVLRNALLKRALFDSNSDIRSRARRALEAVGITGLPKDSVTTLILNRRFGELKALLEHKHAGEIVSRAISENESVRWAFDLSVRYDRDGVTAKHMEFVRTRKPPTPKQPMLVRRVA
jgi:hypothetical protein